MVYLGNQPVVVEPTNFLDSTGFIRVNPQTLTANLTVTTGWNGSTIGTLTIPSGLSVIIQSGARWVIL